MMLNSHLVLQAVIGAAAAGDLAGQRLLPIAVRLLDLLLNTAAHYR